MNNSFIKWDKYPADVLIIAGDTANSIGQASKAINNISKHYDNIVVVPGNHEHYANSNQKRTVQDASGRFSELLNNNVSYLPNGPVKIGDIWFVGNNGWYSFDYNGDPSHNKAVYMGKDSVMNDNHNIGFSALDQLPPWELAIREYDELNGHVKDITESDNNAKIMVVTHTAPLRQSLSEKPEHLVYNPFYANLHMSKIMDDYPNNIIGWAHGHTHYRSMKYYNNGIPIIVNPRGYQNQNTNWEPVVLDF